MGRHDPRDPFFSTWFDQEIGDHYYAGKVTIGRTRVDVPMLVLRGEWLKAIGFPIGATAFLSTDKRGDITLTRMGLACPRKLRVVKSGDIEGGGLKPTL
jgi:hypothetical protein